MTDINNPVFKSEKKARQWLEARLWPDGPVCPHCGSYENITKLKGKKHRDGLYQCNDTDCRDQFTVTVGTLFERSKIPVNKWLLATFPSMLVQEGNEHPSDQPYAGRLCQVHVVHDAPHTRGHARQPRCRSFGRPEQGGRSRRNLCRWQGQEPCFHGAAQERGRVRLDRT